jgi:hypothetical protein
MVCQSFDLFAHPFAGQLLQGHHDPSVELTPPLL